MRALLLAAAVAPMLSGCFFVFIPGSLIDAAVGAPKYCVPSHLVVGNTFTFNGSVYRVTKLKGDSPYYCRDNPTGKLGVDADLVGPIVPPA